MKFKVFMAVAIVLLSAAGVFSPGSIKAVESGSAAKFSDVPDTHWGVSAIYGAVDKGYVSGYSDGTFKPNDPVTRAEFITMAVNALRIPHSAEGTPWYQPYVAVASEMGIHSEKDFNSDWNKPITRLEMARIVARSLALNDDYKAYLESFNDLYNGDLPFVDYRKFEQKDVPLLALAFGSRVFSGYPDASFGVDNNATRAEAVVMLNNLDAARQNRPDSYQYLNELKEVAETGTNAETVSQMKLVVNMHNKNEVTVNHENYTAVLKRIYVMPIAGNIVSMYERKFLWDRNSMPEHYLKLEGFAAKVADVTFKKDGNRSLYQTNLAVSGFYYREPQEHFDFISPVMWSDRQIKKGQTDEIVFYSNYEADFPYVDFTSIYGDSLEILLPKQ